MYLFFDTETNGLPRNWKAPVSALQNWPRLVQIAWILFDEAGLEIGRNDHIIKPEGFTIPKSATEIHGITTEQAQAAGVGLDVVLDEFQAQLDQAHTLVAHNISFDEKIMGAEFLRLKRADPIPSKMSICTMQTTTDFVGIPGPYGNKWPKLGELHIKLFQEDFAEAHNAAADINATARCFWEARRRGIL